jgi:hypothetical protein
MLFMTPNATYKHKPGNNVYYFNLNFKHHIKLNCSDFCINTANRRHLVKNNAVRFKKTIAL